MSSSTPLGVPMRPSPQESHDIQCHQKGQTGPRTLRGLIMPWLPVANCSVTLHTPRQNLI